MQIGGRADQWFLEGKRTESGKEKMVNGGCVDYPDYLYINCKLSIWEIINYISVKLLLPSQKVKAMAWEVIESMGKTTALFLLNGHALTTTLLHN